MKELILAAIISSLITTIVATILGMIWYGPLFGKTWMKVMGVHFDSTEDKKKAQKGMLPIYLTQMFVTFIMFLAFAYFNLFVGPLSVVGGIMFALVVWFGFVMPIEAGAALWSGKTKKLAWQMFLINTFYQMVCFAVAGLVWTLTYPYFFA